MSMDKNCVILTENLHKEYRLGVIGTGTLRHDLQSWFAKKRGKEDPNRRIGMRDVADGDTFMAVDGIDLEIYRGERVGIIGANGAGKSTLLKLLSRITSPTEGRIAYRGRIQREYLSQRRDSRHVARRGGQKNRSDHHVFRVRKIY